MKAVQTRIPLLGYQSEKGEDAYKRSYELLTPFKKIDDGKTIQIQEKVDWKDRTNVGYLYSSRPLKREGASIDQQFCLNPNQFECCSALGYHTYGGYWMFTKQEYKNL